MAPKLSRRCRFKLCESYALDSYDIDVALARGIPCISNQGTLQVRQDHIAKVIEREISPFQDLCPDPYRNLTISAVFKSLQDQLAKLDTSQTSLRVEFERTRGFVISCVEDCSYRIGFIGASLGDCVTSHKFSNFVPMPGS